jgi:hypothetical protein
MVPAGCRRDTAADALSIVHPLTVIARLDRAIK